ncbi:hypothetical protein ABZ297_30135 [Nonomuraea sp. NPDC005983]|uniref:hypothetical protein n=1 Tax=Nonomuraea sp. NPDC005983 TaxID=3155595 RepID=UPI0033AAB8F3
MRTKRVVMLACPALLSALAFGAASPASAAPSHAKTTTVASASAVVPDPDMNIAKPPKKRAKGKAQFNRGYNSGYMEGRSDCRNKKPFNLTMSGGGAYGKGFRHGYTTGFHSCTPPA